MIVFNVNPVSFSIGPIPVRWYGLMYVVGITGGLLAAWPYAKSKGFTTGQFEKRIFLVYSAFFALGLEERYDKRVILTTI
jgi:prolipoprotein diacylglyceryltransferase